jgi:diacylglycerol kinase (ATP)
MATENIWLIVNYKSGKNNATFKQSFEKLLQNYPHIQVHETQYAKHAALIAENAVNEGINKVIAVGGDGTINEVAAVLMGSRTQLGIVPKGSGNGLARMLGIAMSPAIALKAAVEKNSQTIDCCILNQIPFFCTAGMGFDAAVAMDFAHRPGRGLLNYARASMAMLRKYKPIQVQIEHDGTIRNERIYTLTFANAGQYGNNAWIAPKADLTDGLLDVVILKPYPIVLAPAMVLLLFLKKIHLLPQIETIKTNRIKVTANEQLLIHFDGEPIQLQTNTLDVQIDKKKLQIIY